MAGSAHRPGPAPRLHRATPTSWDFAPRVVVRQDVTTRPAHDGQGRASASSPSRRRPQETNSVFGMSGPHEQPRHPVRRRRRARVHAARRGLARGLLQAARQPRRAGPREHRERRGLRRRDAHPLQARRALLRLDRVHAVAQPAARSSREPRCASSSTTRRTSSRCSAATASAAAGSSARASASSSGYMYTPNSYGFYDENVGTYLPLSAYPPYGSRLPLFHSLDLRVDKTWKFGWGKLGAYLDVLNVYNQGNVDGTLQLQLHAHGLRERPAHHPEPRRSGWSTDDAMRCEARSCGGLVPCSAARGSSSSCAPAVRGRVARSQRCASSRRAPSPPYAQPGDTVTSRCSRTTGGRRSRSR